jgi:hypothetical protein
MYRPGIEEHTGPVGLLSASIASTNVWKDPQPTGTVSCPADEQHHLAWNIDGNAMFISLGLSNAMSISLGF